MENILYVTVGGVSFCETWRVDQLGRAKYTTTIFYWPFLVSVLN